MEAAKREEAAKEEVDAAESKEAPGKEGSAGVDMNAVAAKLVGGYIIFCSHLFFLSC